MNGFVDGHLTSSGFGFQPDAMEWIERHRRHGQRDFRLRPLTRNQSNSNTAK